MPLGLNELTPSGVVVSLYKCNTFRVRVKVNFQMWYYFPCLPFVLFVYYSTTCSHQDLFHPVFVLHGPGPHRHRWGTPLGSAQCYISNVCFIHISCHHLTHQDLLHPVFVLHGPGPHRHRWGPPLGSAQCYISNVCFIHISCHHLLPSGSPLSGVRTPWSWPSQTPVRHSTGECSVLYF